MAKYRSLHPKKRYFDKGIVKEQVEVLEVRSEDIFNFFKGATLVLNPYSDYGKELLPNEIEGLLWRLFTRWIKP